MSGERDLIVQDVIRFISECKFSFFKYITANETGENGSHQADIFIPKKIARAMFGLNCLKGSNEDRFVHIRWEPYDVDTTSRTVYYGQGSRDEARLTRFGKGFFLSNDSNLIGSMLVMGTTEDSTEFKAFVIQTDEGEETFLNAFGFSPVNACMLIEAGQLKEERDTIIENYLSQIGDKFPESAQISAWSEIVCSGSVPYGKSYDTLLLEYTQTEYALFRKIEEKLYLPIIKRGFSSMKDFLDLSLALQNRRKSRAGKSLEHHLAFLFRMAKLRFEEQVITEDKKKPDFVFPGGKEYHDPNFPANKLVVLGAKTTCKDRWRQVVTEADRVTTKYLCTLQQGNSPAQMKEMADSHVKLVVPKAYIKAYPKEWQSSLLSLDSFIQFVKETSIR